MGRTYPKSEPWVAPPGDGKSLSKLSLASDVWVYGLLFCEALTGLVTASPPLSPLREHDRDELQEGLGRNGASAKLAEIVVNRLLAPRAADRMSMQEFRGILGKEWKM